MWFFWYYRIWTKFIHFACKTQKYLVIHHTGRWHVVLHCSPHLIFLCLSGEQDVKLVEVMMKQLCLGHRHSTMKELIRLKKMKWKFYCSCNYTFVKYFLKLPIIYIIFIIVQYQLYNGRSVARQYTGAARADPFHQHQLVSSILCPPGYQGMGSPAKHVTVVTQQPPPQLQIQPPIISQQVIQFRALQSNRMNNLEY